MKFLITLIICFASSAYAIGPFGSGVTLKSLKGIDDANCSAGHILKKIHFETGINLADGNSSRVWKCDDPSLRLKCPLPQYTDLDGKQFTCYNQFSGGPYVCVGAPSSDLVGKDAQPRFRELHIFNIDNMGYKRQSFYKMDATGCQPQKVETQDNIGTTGTGNFSRTFEACAKEVENAMSGKRIYPRSRNEETRELKFCSNGKITPDFVSAYYSTMKRTMRCFEMFPAFETRFNKYLSEKNNPSSKRGGRDREGTQ